MFCRGRMLWFPRRNSYALETPSRTRLPRVGLNCRTLRSEGYLWSKEVPTDNSRACVNLRTD